MSTTQSDNQIPEQSVKVQTSFKVADVEPLQDLKEAFMLEYQDQPELLIEAGFMISAELAGSFTLSGR